MRGSMVGTRETSVAPGAVPPPGVEAVVHGERRPGVQRPWSRPTARRRGRAAGRPATGRGGVDVQPGAGGGGRGGHRLVGEHHRLGLAGGAAGGHDQGVALLDRLVRPGGGQDPLAAGAGSRGSTGGTASPSSQARRRRSTNASVPGPRRRPAGASDESGSGQARPRDNLWGARAPAPPSRARPPPGRTGWRAPAPDAARGHRAGAGRHRLRRRADRHHRLAGDSGRDRGPGPAGGHQLRQRLQRRCPRHRHAIAGSVPCGWWARAALARRGEAGGAAAFGVAGVRAWPWPSRSGPSCWWSAPRHRRRLVLHRREAPLRLPRPGRAVRVRVLRRGGHRRVAVRAAGGRGAGWP